MAAMVGPPMAGRSPALLKRFRITKDIHYLILQWSEVWGREESIRMNLEIRF